MLSYGGLLRQCFKLFSRIPHVHTEVVPMFIFPLIFLGNKDEKDRSKQDKKAEEKAAKQEKKKEKHEAKHKKNTKDIEYPPSMLNNDSLNTGTYNKVYDEDFDANEEYINDRELSSGIQMMNLRTSEGIGKIL